VVPDVLAAFEPTILVTQHGCDSHKHDPLADLNLTLDGQRASYAALAGLADELCDGRWVATGGGGYAVLHVVPRAWSHLLGYVAGAPIAPETPTPEAWRAEHGRYAPTSMTDGGDPSWISFERGFNPESRIDQAIIATRQAVFPEWGLDLGF
jgi:acetoin utilization protein AcuC